MPYTLNGAPLQSAEIVIPRHTRWAGTVSVAGELKLADGAPVVLVLGDLTLAGHKVCGGAFDGESEYSFSVAAGTGGWARTIAEKSYSIPGGVKLRDVALELAKVTGETIEIGADRVLGDHWTRPAGVASAALSALFPLEAGGWRIDPDGVTRAGVRPPAPLPAGLLLALEDYKPELRWARVSLADDVVSALLPGAILTAPTLTTPIVVGTTTIRAAAESVSVEVLGEDGLVELLAAIVQALMPRVFLGEYTYQVVDTDPSRPNLRSLSSVPGLPSTLAAEKIPGVPGVTSTLAKDALVLLAFRDGNPGRPYVSRYLGGVLPLSVELAAENEVDIIAPVLKLQSADVQLGGGTQVALAKAAPLTTWAALVNGALAAAGHPVAALSGAATTNVKGS